MTPGSRLAAAMAFLAFALAVRTAAAQYAVIDSLNLAQNTLTAARALQQINNQVQALQNQAVMLANMARNLTRLDDSSLESLSETLARINALIDRAQGIGFEVTAAESAFAQAFPQHYADPTRDDRLLADAHLRWQHAMDAFRQTVAVQAQIATNVAADTGTLAALVNASQGAVGSLQAQQAGNELAALSVKQQLQMQSLMAAQYRAQALDAARTAESAEEGQAALRNFLGTGTAYTPR